MLTTFCTVPFSYTNSLSTLGVIERSSLQIQLELRIIVSKYIGWSWRSWWNEYDMYVEIKSEYGSTYKSNGGDSLSVEAWEGGNGELNWMKCKSILRNWATCSVSEEDIG